MAAVATAVERRRYTLPEFLALIDELALAGSQDWTVTTYERQGEELRATAVLRPSDTLRCPLFPELGVPVAALFE